MFNMARKQILLISISNLTSDPRVLGHISVLSRLGDVTTIGFGEKPLAACNHLQLHTRRAPFRTLFLVTSLLLRIHSLSGLLLGYLPQIKEFIRKNPDSFNLICANDANTLLVGSWLRRRFGCPLWVDMHEYAPLENEGDWRWRLLFQPFATGVCRVVLPGAEIVSTVGREIQTRYEREFGRPVELIRNTAHFTPRRLLTERPRDDSSPFRLVHVGVAIRARHLENMFEAIQGLADVSLDLFLLPTDPRYYAELFNLANHQTNAHLRQPVKSDDVINVLSEFDCGLITIPPTNYNYANCLPNKFFQYIQARIPVITGPIPEIGDLVTELGIGWVSETFEPLAIKTKVLEAHEHNRKEMAGRLDLAAERLARHHDDRVRERIAERLLNRSG